jgi:hypothetical protein
MTDSLGPEDYRRFASYLADDLTSLDEIRGAMMERFSDFQKKPGAASHVASKIAEQRTDRVQSAFRELRESTTVAGSEDGRFTAVRDKSGKILGREQNVTIWEDRWGNTMAHNTQTGRRAKLTDASDKNGGGR